MTEPLTIRTPTVLVSVQVVIDGLYLRRYEWKRKTHHGIIESNDANADALKLTIEQFRSSAGPQFKA